MVPGLSAKKLALVPGLNAKKINKGVNYEKYRYYCTSI